MDRFSTANVIAHLFVMGLALTCGAALIGTIGNYLKGREVRPATTFGVACCVFVCLQAVLLSRLPVSAYLLWGAFAVFAGMTVLSYAILAEMFPSDLIGRANGALNVLHLGMAFAIQSAMGAVVDLWHAGVAGRYPVVAYEAAFALPFVLEVAALVWFLRLAPRTQLTPAVAQEPALQPPTGLT